MNIQLYLTNNNKQTLCKTICYDSMSMEGRFLVPFFTNFITTHYSTVARNPGSNNGQNMVAHRSRKRHHILLL